MRRVSAWPAAPVARFLIPFCGGISWIVFFPQLSLIPLLTVSAISASAYLVSLLFFSRLRYSWRILPGVLVAVTVFYSGAALTLLHKADRYPDFFYSRLQPNSVLAVRLTEPLQEKAKSFKVLAEVESVYEDGNQYPVSGNLLLYLQKESLKVKPVYGDILIIANKARPLESPRNPGEFDYAAYMANRQVYHSAWLQAEDWKPTGINHGSSIWKSILAYRQKLAGEVGEIIKEDEPRGIARALLLGEDKELDAHTRASYASTGTLHVLSVSGMHVGILFFILLIFFKPLLKSRTGRIIRMLSLLILLWGYAMLTGLSPSVARSAAMLSLILVGLDYRRVTNIYNIIAASAFGLLLLDPYLLTQVSFQLSYAAILGIVWIQPQIAQHWQPSNWVLKYGWEIIAASIAAQITTLPLSLLYFSQFPIYFLLSNLIIIPISSAALITGSLWLVLAPIPFLNLVAMVPGYITYGLIIAMNWCAARLSSLPYATLEGLYIDRTDFIILCFAIGMAVFAFLYRRRTAFFTGAICFTVFFSGIFYSHYKSSSECRLTVHAINKTAAITIKENGKIFLLADTAVSSNADLMKYHFAGFFNRSYVAQPDVIKVWALGFASASFFYYKSPYGQFGNLKFVWLNFSDQATSFPQKTEVDFLILSRNVKVKLDQLRERIKFQRLIITADNSAYRANRWEDECRKAGIACTNLKKDHSFTLTD